MSLDIFANLLFNKSSDEVVDDVNASLNQGLGYMKGLYSAWVEGPLLSDEGGFPRIPYQTTPIFKFVEWSHGLGSEESLAKMQRAKNGLEVLDQMDAAVNHAQELGMKTISINEGLRQLFPNHEANQVTTDELRAKLNEVRTKLTAETFQARTKEVEQQTKDIVEGMFAISPMLVATAGLRPEWTRELMATHLVGDALTGVFNFRTPGRSEEFSLTDTLSPYLTMATIGLTSKVTGGGYF
jgi:hypothetical protein